MTEHWKLPVPSEDEAKRLLAGPFGAELHRIAVCNMTYLVFGAPGDKIALLRTATCFFVRSQLKLFAVTAGHVLDALRMACEVDPQTACQIGDVIVDPLARQLGRGDRIDIATFEIMPRELEQLNKSPISLWPPDPPSAGNSGVLLAGYPAASIEVAGPRHASFGIYTASAVAQTVTDWHITSRIEWEYVVGRPEFGGLPPRNFDTGGMSGGPMLTVRKRKGLLSFPLAGVIAEGRRLDDTIVAERADFIRADGSVR